MPTGVALGCPLADRVATRHLRRIAQLCELRLGSLCPVAGPHFAYVPPACYHVTLLNSTHFDVAPATNGRDPARFGETELAALRSLMSTLSGGPLHLQLHGLVLTPEGRVIARGYAVDDRLFRIRRHLIDACPHLDVNTPVTAHVKLGHVLSPLPTNVLRAFLDWVTECGTHVAAGLVFHDVFTPAGRLLFQCEPQG
jgi:hypothetical protein